MKRETEKVTYCESNRPRAFSDSVIMYVQFSLAKVIIYEKKT